MIFTPQTTPPLDPPDPDYEEKLEELWSIEEDRVYDSYVDKQLTGTKTRSTDRICE